MDMAPEVEQRAHVQLIPFYPWAATRYSLTEKQMFNMRGSPKFYAMYSIWCDYKRATCGNRPCVFCIKRGVDKAKWLEARSTRKRIRAK